MTTTPTTAPTATTAPTSTTAAVAVAGLHDFGPEAYFRDPAPAPSLSPRGVRWLLSPECPAVFAARHPRLSQWQQQLQRPQTSASFENVVRMLVLQRDSEIEVVNFKDFKTEVARRLKKNALSCGKVAVLRQDYDEARAVADGAVVELAQRLGRWPLPLRDATLMWQRRVEVNDDSNSSRSSRSGSAGSVAAVWLRSRINMLDANSGAMITVVAAASLRSDVLSKRLGDEGCDIHTVMSIAGLSEVLRRPVSHRFAVVQTEPPYLVRVLRMSDGWKATARSSVEKAVRVFAQCMSSGEWPDYDAVAATSATAASAAATSAAATASGNDGGGGSGGGGGEAELDAPAHLRTITKEAQRWD